MTLNELEIGERAIIKKVGGEGVLRRRLLDMGLTPKTEVMILSILVDTFISKISLPMQPVPEIGSISVA